MAKLKYHTIGSMKQKKDKDANGQPQYYIELDKKYQGKIFVKDDKGNFEPITNFIQVERPTAKYDRMLAAGTIDEAEYEQKTALFEKDGKASYVKFDLQMTTEK